MTSREKLWSAWNPGIGTGIPEALRDLETIFRPECVFGRRTDLEELVGLTGLPAEELARYRPARLALHELIVRITAEIAVAEGDEEEALGQNFRRIALTLWEKDIAPRLPAIEQEYAALSAAVQNLVQQILVETLFRQEVPASPAKSARSLRAFFGRNKAAGGSKDGAAESPEAFEQRIIAGFKAAGLATDDALRRAVFKSLYRVLGAIAVKRGRLGADRELLARLVSQQVCNDFGSRRIGESIAPLIDAAIVREAYVRPPYREAPVLISLKGASAAGKSSLRPMIKQIMREQGMAPESYVTVSPDIWRRLLLDYASLGAAYKYAGHLTGRELMVIDGKLDRYIRRKANRDKAMPHLLVDRFRFDSFSSEKVARVLHNTYASHVDTLLMYFVVTPPEATVERGWLRGLERGRYKAVEDFLGHSVEAYTGMPKILFKWLAYKRPHFRYFFLDNSVPKGTFPSTIAFGNQAEMTLYDPVALINIERYQKININATSPSAVYPSAEVLALNANCGFLKECLRRIPIVNFAHPGSSQAYLCARKGRFELIDPAGLQRALVKPELRGILFEIAPEVLEGKSGVV